jgi:hypothetical protein
VIDVDQPAGAESFEVRVDLAAPLRARTYSTGVVTAACRLASWLSIASCARVRYQLNPADSAALSCA